ncbi:MAG: hypothetical protein ACKOET_13225, partial [Verrucomicrobiota bacterium]
MSVGTDRTDVNDDDSYVVYAGRNPRDVSAVKVGEFERFAPAFQANTKNENLFSVNAPAAGLYGFRLVHWQGGRGSNLQWYTVDASGVRTLLNDPSAVGSVPAFRAVNDAAASGPYVAEISPSPGSAGNPPSAPIEALIVDGAATVAAANVKLFLNGAAVTPQALAKTGSQTRLRYDPNASRQTADNQVALVYTDSAGATRTNAWSFKINVSGGSTTTVAGQWDFDQGDLRATVGTPLAYFTPEAQQKTRFGTTAELGVGDIDGQAARVMEIPGDVNRNIAYVMTHGIAPNGGGTRVNQYTLIMD